MTPGEWIGVGTGVTGMLVGAAALGRLLTTHGGDRQRLADLERWQQTRSVDRSEYDALATRVGSVEGDVREVCKQVADVARQVAVSDARLVGLGDLMKAQGDALSHQMRNLRMALEGRRAEA